MYYNYVTIIKKIIHNDESKRCNDERDNKISSCPILSGKKEIEEEEGKEEICARLKKKRKKEYFLRITVETKLKVALVIDNLPYIISIIERETFRHNRQKVFREAHSLAICRPSISMNPTIMASNCSRPLFSLALSRAKTSKNTT